MKKQQARKHSSTVLRNPSGFKCSFGHEVLREFVYDSLASLFDLTESFFSSVDYSILHMSNACGRLAYTIKRREFRFSSLVMHQIAPTQQPKQQQSSISNMSARKA